MTDRELCLDTAKKMICGEREQDYGIPEDNFQLIVNFWNDYIGSLRRKEKTNFLALDSKDVAVMMILLKIARIATGVGTADSFIDIAGYAACGYEVHSNSIIKEGKNASIS